jgi:hypothetical protein
MSLRLHGRVRDFAAMQKGLCDEQCVEKQSFAGTGS